MRKIIIYLIIGSFFAPLHTLYAASSFKVEGWIPWWQESKGIESAISHIDSFTTLHPFVFQVNASGTLIDKGGINEDGWNNLKIKAQSKGIEVIPTITWVDSENIHKILKDEIKRAEHITAITQMVKNAGFDGVDIDYENKKAETKNYFSLFLKELKQSLGDKKLTCAIEARTPESSKAKTTTSPEYSNDYSKIAEYCDRVEIMAYDQRRIDVVLNTKRKGEPYIPIADIEWVKKVIELAVKTIPKEKIILGIPTYGKEWTITVAPEWYKDYTVVSSHNLPAIKKIAENAKTNAGVTKSNEKAFTYFPEISVYKILNQLPVPPNTRTGFEAAAKALLFATYAKTNVPVNIVWYMDKTAIQEREKLAKEYGLLGVSYFKIDGEEDVW